MADKKPASDWIKPVLETMTDEQLEVVSYMAGQLKDYFELIEVMQKQTEAWDDLSVAVKAMRFDLDCTRKERDDLRDEIDRLKGN